MFTKNAGAGPEPEVRNSGLYNAAPTVVRTRILALVAEDSDRELLARVAQDQGWAIRFARTCGEAWEILNSERIPIVLYDRDLPATDWREGMHILSSAPLPVYLILLSRVADDYLWSEVIRRGGYDLVPTPLRREDVLRAIRLGWSFWSNSMRVPPMLVKHYR